TLFADLPKVREVYNSAWEKNWGFVPMTAEEMEFMAGRLKPVLDEEFAFLGERRREDGPLEPVAFLLAMPDYNVAVAATKGRLLPFGWMKFLLAQKKIKTLRVLTLGIKSEYRMRGINAVMFESGLRASLKRGLTGVEVSWLLEDNDLVIRAVKMWGGRLYKTYRIYERAIDA
ncbi:MAG TPA: N-acetyltransferase, partial [Thermoanaerobaculia bacterium]|nr:N-acetyltransferase [Thermoanaerobaculia bacterium]